MYENMNAAYALQKILLINIRASKEGPANAALRQKLQDRIKAVQEAIDENNRKIQGLGG
jgi:type VI protein secretion system component VasF